VRLGDPPDLAESEGCLDRIESGQWNSDSVKALKASGRVEETIRGMGGRGKYDEVWQARMEASGFNTRNFTTQGEHVHELWEWHDGQQVHMALDRSLLVAGGENPVCGMKPFMAYRPTPLQKQMVGIGDLEPLEHLQRGVDTTVSQAVDMVTRMLAAGYVYDSSMIDDDDLTWHPHKAIEVRNGRPSEAIAPIPNPDINPGAFRHLDKLEGWMDAVGGVTEALSPQSGGAAGTATEAFLVQAALSRRVQLASRRFEIEVVRRAARAFLYLDQRMILENREMVLPGEGMTIEQAASEAGQLAAVRRSGPAGCMGDFLIMPEGGSYGRQERAAGPAGRADVHGDVRCQHPNIDRQAPVAKALKLYGRG
jgi:hypothetical protein